MRQPNNILLYCICLLFCVPCAKAQPQAENDATILSLYSELPFDMPRVSAPTFPDRSVSILDFGAESDGTTLNTEAFKKAIDQVSGQGGGTVVVPSGIFLTGPVTLKDNINLYLERGAVILFSEDKELYPLVKTSFEGLETVRCVSPINAEGAENIAITGHGIIDGSGGAWRPVKKSKLTAGQWESLVASGGLLNQKGDIWYPSEGALKGVEMSSMNVPDEMETLEDYEEIHDFLRPVMVSLVSCKNVLLDGPTFQNSPAWNIHPLMCENVIIRNLSVKNPWFSQNGDGLDLESCKNVLIYNNSFDVGDDAICFKSGKDEDGRQRGMPTENVIVKNCVVYHGHGGFVIGSEMSGGVKNVKVSDCTFIGTDVGLRFKSTRGRGGVVENIWISDIDMMDIPTEPIRFNLYYSGKSSTEAEMQGSKEEIAANWPKVTEETPSFQDIHVKNIVCKGAGRALFLQGLPEMKLKNVSLENMVVTAEEGGQVIDAQNIQLKNIKIAANQGPAMIFRNAQNIATDDLSLQTQKDVLVKIEGIFSENINLGKSGIDNSSQLLEIGNGVEKTAVSFE